MLSKKCEFSNSGKYIPNRRIRGLLFYLPIIRHFMRTRGTAAPITIRTCFIQKILGFNRQAYWPVHFTSRVLSSRKIRIGIGTAPGLSPGCYIQGNNGIEIGDYTLISPNVGLISANHSIYCIFDHEEREPIRIGSYCWIGMNTVILPGVCIGDHTIIGAGSVVNKSFPEGYCVIAGTPAKVLKQLDKSKILEPRNKYEYIGYHELKGNSKEQIYKKLGVIIF